MLDIQQLSQYVGKDGYTKVHIDNEAAMSHTAIIFRENDIYVNESLIPYDHKTATVVYFVSSTDGSEYGQFKEAHAAKDVALKIATLPINERATYAR